MIDKLVEKIEKILEQQLMIGTTRNEEREWKAKEIADLIRKAIPKEEPIYNEEGHSNEDTPKTWNACRQQIMKNLGGE